MKKFAQILIIVLLLTGAGRVWAQFYEPPEPEIPTQPAPLTESQQFAQLFQDMGRPDYQLSLNRAFPVGSTNETMTSSVEGVQRFMNWINSSYRDCYTDFNCRKKLDDVNGHYLSLLNSAKDQGLNVGGIHQTAQKNATDNLPECSITQLGNCILRTMGWLGQILVWLFSWLVYAANEFFDVAINLSVRRFGAADGPANLPGVVAAWKICRNLVNISFIFVLLYVAIGTILRLDSVNGKKLLSKIIIAALLVNFSAFFTRITIDASNVVANQFYTAAAGGELTRWGAPDLSSKLTAVDTNAFFSLKSAFGDRPGEDGSLWDQMGALLGSYFGQIVLMLVTTTVLLAGALMFLTRTIVLIFIIVLSPIAFLGFAVGGELGKLAADWRKKWINQLIFAPAYLLLIYLTVQVVSAGGEAGLAAMVGGDGGLISSLIVFAIVNGLMIASLIAAKSLGVAGAAGATKFGGALTGFGTKLVTRPVGGVLASAYGSIKSRLPEAKEGGVIDRTSKFASRLALKPGIKEFKDVVSSGRVIRDTAKAAFTTPDVLINEGIKAATDVQILGRTRDDERDAAKRAKDDKEAANEQKRKDKEIELQKIAGDTPKGTLAKPLSEEQIKTQEEHEKKVREVSNKDIVKIDSDTLVKLAHLLSDSQMTALGDSKDGIDPKKFAKIKTERERPLRESIKEGRENIVEKEIDKMSNKALANFIAELDEKDADMFEKTLRAIASNIDERILGELAKVGGGNRSRLGRIARYMPSGGASVPGAQGGRAPINATNNPGRPTNLRPGETMSPGGIITS